MKQNELFVSVKELLTVACGDKIVANEYGAMLSLGMGFDATIEPCCDDVNGEHLEVVFSSLGRVFHIHKIWDEEDPMLPSLAGASMLESSSDALMYIASGMPDSTSAARFIINEWAVTTKHEYFGDGGVHVWMTGVSLEDGSGEAIEYKMSVCLDLDDYDVTVAWGYDFETSIRISLVENVDVVACKLHRALIEGRIALQQAKKSL